ncbi:MAG TPA: Calx-beta domain-containing protein, partial [Verrucomicrobiae bacterium]
LSGRTGLPITTNILGTPVHTSSSSGSQTLGYSFTPTTNLTVTHVRHYYGTKVSIWTDDGVLLATQAVTSVNGTWVETPLASPLPLTAGTRYRVTVFTGGGNFYWRTDLGTNFPHGTIDQSYSRSGDFFPTTPDTARWWFAGLRYTVTPSVSVPITPVVSGNFIQGIWTGAVTVAQSGANIFLRADDNNGHPASSGYFDVVATNDLLLSVSDMPDPASLGQLINYAIVVTNTGPTTATGVVVTNRLSAAVSIASSTASQGTLATNGNEIVATFGSLGTGSNATLTVQIMSLATGVITNTTFVARAEPDGDLSNNSATNLTTVTAPAISITDVSVTEGNAGVTNAVFTVSLSSTSAASVSVSFAASNGTATAGADYAVTNGVLIFTPGQTNQTIVVGVLGDLLDETNETLFVNLSAPTNATFAKAQGTGTITDDDPAPSLSINNVSVTEGNVGATSAVFTVSLSAISGRTVTVQFATTNGSAVAPADYLSTNGLLMFAAGQTNRQIVVTVGGDIAIESNETFQVVLSSPTNATLAFAQGTNTIVNDDGLPGQLDHFVWGTINVTQVVNVPFPALITARDASNNLATNFTGPAGLFGLAATVSNQFHDGFEDGDFSDWTIGADASSRSVTNGLAAVGSNSFTMSGGFSNHYGGITHALTNLAPAWVHFRVRSAATNTAAGYFVLGTNAVASNSAVFFLMRDTGVMGLSLNSNTAPQAPYQSNTWYKISLRFNWTARQVDYYVDDALIGAAIPFRNPNPSVSNLTRVDLYNFSPGSQAWWDEIDFLGVSATFPVSIAPTNTGTFVLGAWAGLITVQQPATNLLLFAGDGNGHTNPPSFFLTVLADTDSDGIPDVYENAHGMNPNDPGDAAMDFDGDGLSNLQEYLAGTDPNDPQNFLQIISVTLSGADAQVSFTSIAGKLYRVERSDDVAGGMWITVTNNVSGTGAIVMANDPGGASPAQRTYRVRLLP